MSARRSRRTPCSLQAAGQGAAATVRRELHYSCRQKTELWGLRICWTLFWGLTWLRGHVSDVCSFVAWSPCTSSSCTFGPSWRPRGVYLPLPASASWTDAHWWPWGGWLCTWDLQWPHETMPLPALWGKKKKKNKHTIGSCKRNWGDKKKAHKVVGFYPDRIALSVNLIKKWCKKWT